MEEELAQKMLLLNKAHSAALQAQINPHFLYNTLETIRMTILLDHDGEETDASHMLEQLSDWFRIRMQSGEYLTTLEDEIYSTELYIDIIRPRHEKTISVQWNIPEELRRCKIVKLTLQPVIENAIQHGINPKNIDGIILIHVYRQEDQLFIDVIDNGCGMDEKHMQELNNLMNDCITIQDSHIGLINTNQRIRLLFGERCGIHILSSGSNGTVVRVVFPFAVLSDENMP